MPVETLLFINHTWYNIEAVSLPHSHINPSTQRYVRTIAVTSSNSISLRQAAYYSQTRYYLLYGKPKQVGEQQKLLQVLDLA